MCTLTCAHTCTWCGRRHHSARCAVRGGPRACALEKVVFTPGDSRNTRLARGRGYCRQFCFSHYSLHAVARTCGRATFEPELAGVPPRIHTGQHVHAVVLFVARCLCSFLCSPPGTHGTRGWLAPGVGAHLAAAEHAAMWVFTCPRPPSSCRAYCTAHGCKSRNGLHCAPWSLFVRPAATTPPPPPAAPSAQSRRSSPRSRARAAPSV